MSSYDLRAQTRHMPEGLKKKWVEALRSGRYLQGRGCLKQKDTSFEAFCCIGVLADLVNPNGWKTTVFGRDNAFAWESDNQVYMIIPGRVNATHASLTRLAELNDKGSSFEEIATEIERDENL